MKPRVCAGLLFLLTHHPIMELKTLPPFKGVFEKKREAGSKPHRSRASLCLSFPHNRDITRMRMSHCASYSKWAQSALELMGNRLGMEIHPVGPRALQALPAAGPHGCPGLLSLLPWLAWKWLALPMLRTPAVLRLLVSEDVSDATTHVFLHVAGGPFTDPWCSRVSLSSGERTSQFSG